jgi:hypothetical protein
MLKSIRSAVYSGLSMMALLFLVCNQVSGQGYVSIYKDDNGTIRLKSPDEIRSEEARLRGSKNYEPPKKEFDKPKNGVNGSGEIWVDGYCRFRPASSSKSRYNEDVSEAEYCRAVYPTEMIVQSDDFKGNGTIPWAANAWFSATKQCRALQERISSQVGDGIPFTLYDSLQKMSAFFSSTASGYKEGRKYEFSRAVSIWVKRMTGPDKMSLKLTAEYPFTNGEDHTDFEINDNGQYKVSRFCNNCKSPMYKEVESGKSKAWIEGGWNELTMKKDEFNTVTVYINQEEVCRYQLSALPIAVRYARFNVKMPYEWEKKKLMYNIKQVAVISYPQMQ